MKKIIFSVFEQVGGNSAVSTEDGQLLFERIQKAFDNDMKVVLDFTNIELITSTFLNATVGQLYHKHNSPFIRMHLQIQNMAQEDIELLKRVVDRAKKYFQNKKQVEKAIREGMKNG